MVPWPAPVWNTTAAYFFTVVILVVATWVLECMQLVKRDNAR